MMLRRVVIISLVFAFLCPAQTANDRLVATVKLWAYVKYMHSRVTASSVDWDAAFAKACPKVLEAATDRDFEAAVAQMLSGLKDPVTRVAPSMQELIGDQTRMLSTLKQEDGVTVLRLELGDMQQAAEMRNTLPNRLAGVGPVVFDLRGSKIASYWIPPTLPVAKASIGPSVLIRKHLGYANETATGSGRYRSVWEVQEGVRLQVAAGGIRPVFLVNSKTWLPMVALAIQNSGEGAIVSEDPIGDEQVDLTRSLPVLGTLQVMVRYQELSYPDGTTGLSANVVLNKTGAEALKAAKEVARSGNWPAPLERPKLDLPSARFQEEGYADQPYPTREYRMLAAARIWGVFHYFHPYLNLYNEDWDTVLAEFLPRMANAANAREYQVAVAEMVSHTYDTHCSVSSPELRLIYGAATPALEVRWIENRPVVTRLFDRSLEETVRPGDVVLRIDGKPVRERIEELKRLISASTPQSMMNRVMQLLLNGSEGSTVRVGVRTDDGPEREIKVVRASSNFALFSPLRPGEVFRLITPRIGYVDLDRLTNEQVDTMFEKFKETQSIIMDMRAYPRGTAWTIAPRLAPKPAVVTAQFRRNVVTPDLVEGSDLTTMLFEQRIPITNKPRYEGRTVMLIDERAMSQAEHSGLFYRAANGTVFIGSPTQGVDGDTTYFTVPGGIRIGFSGQEVRWPDGRQLQRVGLTPDIEVRPTIAGIQAGRDEILERAVAFIENSKK
jgi:C-terminal processing protease CtpA/Prc